MLENYNNILDAQGRDPLGRDVIPYNQAEHLRSIGVPQRAKRAYKVGDHETLVRYMGYKNGHPTGQPRDEIKHIPKDQFIMAFDEGELQSFVRATIKGFGGFEMPRFGKFGHVRLLIEKWDKESEYMTIEDLGLLTIATLRAIGFVKSERGTS